MLSPRNTQKSQNIFVWFAWALFLDSFWREDTYLLKMPNSFQMEALQATYRVQENGDSFVKKHQRGRSTGKSGFAQPTFNKESPAMGILQSFQSTQSRSPFRKKIIQEQSRRNEGKEKGEKGGTKGRDRGKKERACVSEHTPQPLHTWPVPAMLSS